MGDTIRRPFGQAHFWCGFVGLSRIKGNETNRRSGWKLAADPRLRVRPFTLLPPTLRVVVRRASSHRSSGILRALAVSLRGVPRSLLSPVDTARVTVPEWAGIKIQPKPLLPFLRRRVDQRTDLIVHKGVFDCAKPTYSMRRCRRAKTTRRVHPAPDPA